jgi:hypothetical protein
MVLSLALVEGAAKDRLAANAVGEHLFDASERGVTGNDKQVGHRRLLHEFGQWRVVD